MGFGRPRFNREFGFLSQMVSSADARPTDQAMERFAELDANLTLRLNELEEGFRTDLADFNRAVRDTGMGAVMLPARWRAGVIP